MNLKSLMPILHLNKLHMEWVQAFGAKISAIEWVTSVSYDWLGVPKATIPSA